jgi:hypothetical protein
MTSTMTPTELVAQLQLPEEYFSFTNQPPQHTILSQGIKQKMGGNYMPREPTPSCFTVNQKNEDATAQLGDSFLVRKNEYTTRRSLIPRTSKDAWNNSAWEKGTYEVISFVVEYGITRVDLPSKWVWNTVCYLQGEESPYPFLQSRWVPFKSPF